MEKGSHTLKHISADERLGTMPGRRFSHRADPLGFEPILEWRTKEMLTWAIVLLIVSIIAGLLGFSGIAGTAAWIAKTLFVVFLIMFLSVLIFGGWIASHIFGRKKAP